MRHSKVHVLVGQTSPTHTGRKFVMLHSNYFSAVVISVSVHKSNSLPLTGIILLIAHRLSHHLRIFCLVTVTVASGYDFTASFSL